MKTEELFEKGSVWKAIIKMSIPTIAVMLVMTIYSMADLIFIGHTGDAAQIAAVSLASPFFSLQMTLGTLIGGGGCTAISTALGARDHDRAKALSSACTILCVVGGIVLGGVFLLLPDPFLKLFGADTDTWQHTKDYLRILAAGTPAVVFSNAFANLVRAEGSMKEAVLFNLLGTITNIILDPVLISGLHMGVRGAALATVIGNILSTAAILIYLRRKETILTLNPKYALQQKDSFVKVITLGVPSSISNLLMGLTNTISNNIAIQYGASIIAAMGVGGKAGMIVAMIVMAIALGVQPMIAYNYGANNTTRTKEIVRKSAVFVTVTGIILTVACYLLRTPIARLFVQDEALITQSTHIMSIGLIGLPLLGLYYLSTNYLQSTGHPLLATILSIFRQGIIYAPALIAMHILFGMEGIFWTSPLTDLLSIALAVILLIPRKKQIKTAQAT